MSTMTSKADLRLKLSDKITEALMYFNEYDTDDARRAVEDIVDDMMETMGVEFDEQNSTSEKIITSINLYDPTEYFTGLTIDVDK
jgi:hypothetical protein